MGENGREWERMRESEREGEGEVKNGRKTGEKQVNNG